MKEVRSTDQVSCPNGFTIQRQTGTVPLKKVAGCLYKWTELEGSSLCVKHIRSPHSIGASHSFSCLQLTYYAGNKTQEDQGQDLQKNLGRIYATKSKAMIRKTPTKLVTNPKGPELTLHFSSHLKFHMSRSISVSLNAKATQCINSHWGEGGGRRLKGELFPLSWAYPNHLTKEINSLLLPHSN